MISNEINDLQQIYVLEKWRYSELEFCQYSCGLANSCTTRLHLV